MAVWGVVPQAVGQHGAMASSSPPEWEPKPDVPLLQITITLHNGNVLMVIYCLSFFKFIFAGWRLITLQYCTGFCHALT